MNTATELLREIYADLEYDSKLPLWLRDKVRTFLASEPEAEPRVWMMTRDDIEGAAFEFGKEQVETYWKNRGYKIEPLYTRPAEVTARKPMTEAECEELIMEDYRMENKTDIMDRFKTISDSIRTNQIKAMKSMIERTDKKIDQKINEACKRIYEKVLEEIKGKLELIHDIDKVQTDIRELRKMTDDLIEKHTVLTEVSYIARNRLDKEGQARLNAELIRSMDFPGDWFKKRNDMSLDELFKMYQNGVDKGQ